ncbi:MAG TPA: hypothetical protein VJV05_03930 [Pyrinomonadaceae bacterium]|nr:hypothetical protein [Pyrinomonadaceae bacterium]
MPFENVYRVNFANGNLQPDWNPIGWPRMKVTDPATAAADPEGLKLSLVRRPTGPADPLSTDVYVAPRGGLSLDARLLLRVGFDLPNAVPARFPRGVEPIPPEPWAVTLWVSPTTQLASTTSLNVTCQFRTPGIRLNTPGSLQKDQGATSDAPLDYLSYQRHQARAPGSNDYYIEVGPPVFTLEHSFCGWNARTNGHTPGMGALEILRPWLEHPPWSRNPKVKDHRVYSSTAMLPPGATTSIQDKIRALGVSIATINGMGRMSARLRTFEIWVNVSAPPV